MIRRLSPFVIAGLIGLPVVLILLLTSAAPQAQAANFDLTASCPGGVGDVAALVSAINTANTNGEADTITLAAGCVYTLTAVDNIDNGSNGLPAITSTITIIGNGAVIGRDPASVGFRIFHVSDLGELTLSDLTVRNGLANGIRTAGDGGGIYCIGAPVTLTNATLVSNAATRDGGGIQAETCIINVIDSGIYSNTASRMGGGIGTGRAADFPTTIIVRNSMLYGNVVTQTNSQGGGIYSEGFLTVEDSSFVQNRATGATAGDGGGIYQIDEAAVITNSTFSGNSATGSGGGIYYDSFGLLLTHVTLHANVADSDDVDPGGGGGDGGGIYDRWGETAIIASSIIAGNVDNSSSGNVHPNVSGVFVSQGYNLIGDSTGSTDFTATGDITNTNPLLDSLALNAPGSTPTHALLPGSPALDHVPGGTNGCGTAVSTDQRGVTRPQPSGGQCDSGAFEVRVFDLTAVKTGTGDGTVTDMLGYIDCGMTCTASLRENTTVTLTATPLITSTFTGWSGPCSGTGACVIVMTADTIVTATFEIITHPLAVNLAGTGYGTVTGAPGGIDCPTGACSASYVTGTVVTLSATPAPTSTFSGWSGACSGTGACAVTMTAAREVTATFDAAPYPLVVNLAGTGRGEVSSTPGGIDCPTGACTASFFTGTVVTLNATPAPTSTFSGWSGDCSGTGACAVTMTAAREVTATFDVVSPPPPSSHALYLPVIIREIVYPDLWIRSLTVEPTVALVGQPVEITLVIENAGPASVDQPFWVDLYIDPDPNLAPPEVNQTWDVVGSQYGIAWRVNRSLAPGQRLTLTSLSYEPEYSDWPGTFNCFGPHILYAQVDSYNGDVPFAAVEESDETNNVFGPVEVSVICPPAAICRSPVAPGFDREPQPTSRPILP